MKRLTLRQLFFLTIAGLAGLLGALFWLLNRASEQALVEASSSMREERTQRIADHVEADVAQKTRSLGHLEGLLRAGAIGADDPVAIEAALFAEVAGESEVSEATFTRAVALAAPPADLQIAPRNRWQVSVYRTADAGGEGPLVTRYVHQEKATFVCDQRARPEQGGFASAGFVRQAAGGVDPTASLTFQTPFAQADTDRVLASDLHWFEADLHLPADERRVVVSGLKAVRDPSGRFLGVLRVGLLTRRLDQLVRVPTEKDPHWVFFCDTQGRLLASLGPGDRVEEFGDDLRVRPAALPDAVAATLQQPALRAVSGGNGPATASFELRGQRYLATYRPLPNTQDWVVAIVAPESAYLGGLGRQRMVLLQATLAIMAVILACGVLTLRSVRRGLASIEASTARMRDFDFSASAPRLPLLDLQDVSDRLELAKTAMRAMGRYVPVDLVRLLFKTGREPVLGGELAQVSLLFSDIEGFTTLSESLDPNEMARALGRYFEVMTAEIHRQNGIIDKYIGDAIMALWNAPTPCPDHPRRACEAALACLSAGKDLCASDEWRGLPALVTRFGIHRDEVMVGHYGAPDRMSYTALGDGVNLASRLEGLNKQYGTLVLVSEAVHQDEKDHFAFRLIDRVAVKGRTRGIQVYELLGPAGGSVPGYVGAYESALAAYWRRDFAGAASVLEAQAEDPPSRVLLERCRRYAQDPPPPDWDGIWVASSK